MRPRLLYSDDQGVIRDHPRLLAVGSRGGEPEPLSGSTLLPLPRGSDLFFLPGRSPLGQDPVTGETVLFEEEHGRPVHAVAAFLAPAHTIDLLAAYRTRPRAPALPLFSYGAVGFAAGRHWTQARRVDPDTRQDPWRFDLPAIERAVEAALEWKGANALLQQLRRCALEYQCRAAQNFFLGRHEAPLPISSACNARCLGCISLQPDGRFKAAHERIGRPPLPEEVAEVALAHIARVPQAVVSFGQGCEGEPLLMGDLIREAVRLIRAQTDRGTVNLNSNASLPGVVAELADLGLDSLRVSMNSAQPSLYEAYYCPRGYRLADVERSMRAMSERGRFVSLNLLYFPGITDREAEVDALSRFLARTGARMIQLRNLNLDPEVYRLAMPARARGAGMGLDAFVRALKHRAPRLRFGYFNPPKERYRRW